MDAEKYQWHQGRQASSIDVYVSREVLSVVHESSVCPYWRDIERNGVYQTQKKAEIPGPSVKDIEPLGVDSGEHTDEVRLCAQGDNPRHHGHGYHTSTDCQGGRSV